MNENLPFIACLCPTYRRPRLLENAIACFLAQDYPADRRYLTILDDAGQIADQAGDGWRLHSGRDRYPSLPEKYNAMAMYGAPRHETEVVVIWEDDDIYLPHHISAHVAALRRSTWSKPSSVLSTYTGKPETEGAAGRFFASIAIKKDLWEQVGGMPVTKRADFDQQFLALLGQYDTPADPLTINPTPGYCFRWGSTAAYHGQGQMRSPDDDTWYDRCADQGDPTPCFSSDGGSQLRPQLDAETQAVYSQFA